MKRWIAVGMLLGCLAQFAPIQVRAAGFFGCLFMLEEVINEPAYACETLFMVTTR